MLKIYRQWSSWFWCVGAGLALQAQAFPLQGEKSLIAETQDGQHTRVGRVVFTPTTPGSASIRVHMDHAVMRDHFLSMREFKCLAAPQEVTCHVPYPYTNPATVSVQNLHWLDHHLLFLYKKPANTFSSRVNLTKPWPWQYHSWLVRGTSVNPLTGSV